MAPSPIFRLLTLALVALPLLPVRADWDDAAAISRAHGERALIIWQRGRPMHETYRNGGAHDRPENLYSITKSIVALTTIAALSKSWLKLDEPVSATLTEWQKDPRKSRITVRDLLQQTSGLSPGYELYAKGLQDKGAAALKLPAVAEPGRTFAYGPSHYEALEVLLQRRLRQPSLDWTKASLLTPLGIELQGWRRDRLGQPYFSAGAFLTARDLLALGHILRRQGWYWLVPLFPAPLMRDSVHGSSANAMYGYGVWLNTQAKLKHAIERDVEEALRAGLQASDWARSCLSRQAPSDLIALVGSEGQRVYIVPSLQMVVVRLGQGSGFRDPEFLAALFQPFADTDTK